MPFRSFEWMNRVKSVEREHKATRLATDLLLGRVHQDTTALTHQLNVRDLHNASDRLEGTYIIRLFAEFETSLRLFWSESKTKNPPSRTRDLLNGVGTGRKIPHDRIKRAHDVREYRNTLVHERERETASISIGEARSYLCHFLSFLPRR